MNMSNRLSKRHAAERRLHFFGVLSVVTAVAMLVLLFSNIVIHGHSAFFHSEVKLHISFDSSVIDPSGARDRQTLKRADYQSLIRASLMDSFPEVRKRRDIRKLVKLISRGASFQLQRMVLKKPSLIGTTANVWVTSSDTVDMFQKGQFDFNATESNRGISSKEVSWIHKLQSDGALRKVFNWRFFSSGDSREPELAGVGGALVGSALTMLVTLLVAFPLGVMTAIYLQEFAPQNHWTDWVEVNINNLAAVPSIVFGLLGLAVFLSIMELPRSAPIVGGLTLALMTLPTIIITSRVAIGAVPPSLREAALAIGASPLQTVIHHVLPAAMPGILTGSIIGMARAVGETAPLLMIGMVAFIVDIPTSVDDPSTVLPVQIYIWADSPERGFAEKTSAAIMVLLLFLVFMNGLAIYLRKRLERRW
tara:strand:+ start:608 stop:1870 length:1263 start_codon:yes stop_codon:yes gene_type:complete